MLPAPDTKRPSCAICRRPLSTCICQWIRPISHVVEVVVLQHPLEVANAKGSARLLCLSLPHSRLVPGEEFDRQELQALLTAPLQPHAGTSSPKQAILLYPDTPDDPALRLPAPPALTSAMLPDPSQLRLIVLDGTWRKSRKMLCLNPLLQQLPRLSLRDTPPSHYLIRKAHRPDQLSTLEATCAALMQLEGSVEPFQPLLTAFDGFVAQQMGYRKK
ncbi:tRNA-uridine aminocarboxypropyltransferase [Rhodoferax sp.]|uniref:tRNA-uridine aminocarboxypropyltransferase n=1 Tax=Rhodoferax sp. TaxID=50421 RepID=UPI0027185EFF|nr:tRNA-uridine aminocarboxypropyltransferase [Rhodoferax sp.]MDO9197880.1 tRNA-uridine aminocarboxypropyltransferase [Rhodoferax sp.]